MRIPLGIFVTVSLSLAFAAAANAADSWTPIPACGAQAPSADDIISNSPLWTCAKAEFQKSQASYLAALNAYAARVPGGEQGRLGDKVAAWKDADTESCTRQASLDYGCAIAALYRRAELLKAALAQCGGGTCTDETLP